VTAPTLNVYINYGRGYIELNSDKGKNAIERFFAKNSFGQWMFVSGSLALTLSFAIEG
jgi:hypothetical protein